MPEYIVEGTDSLFTDFVLVGVNNSTDTIDDQGRCNIRESNCIHYSFFDCKGYFLRDTFVIKFYNKSKIILDTIVLRVVGNKFYSFFHFTETKQICSAEPGGLILKSKVDKKGQKLFGN